MSLNHPNGRAASVGCLMGRETPWYALLGICSRVACLLEDWTPPQDWRVVMLSWAPELALCKIWDSSWELSIQKAEGAVGWKFLTQLEKVTVETCFHGK